ncbi:MAG: two-component sensor histidine kinase [Ramlibacter sp.]|nr:two-component sensor histidine kinase [Ramlibacter sp.]
MKQFAGVLGRGLPRRRTFERPKAVPQAAMPAPASAAPGGMEAAGASRDARPFNLLRWFSIASLAALLPVAAVTGSILSHYITQEALQRDALLTAQFIQNCLDVEAAQIGAVGLSQYLDPRVDPAPAGLTPKAVAQARAEVYEHLETLPDVLLTTVYARDGRIVWSTNRALIGTQAPPNDELDEAFASKADVARHHSSNIGQREEQRFVVEPKDFFIENYVPLPNSKGEIVAVVEVYKEPRNLMAAIQTGQLLVWATTLAGGIVIYLGLFSIIRRGSRLLKQQERQLVDAQSQMFAGEMATALAHSLRNPLASVRSSAELALCTDDLPVRKNAQDIITQVDFLSQWVRELLLYSRPLTGETEAVDVCAVLGGVLASFATSLERSGIEIRWDRKQCPKSQVQGNNSLVRQALHSVISNAVESMPGGGTLDVELHEIGEPEGVELVVRDTGVGMSKQQLATAFKPFHTTKAHGLGVGLPMVQRAMERFGGHVTLSSTENAGTEVRLHFRT